MERRLEGQIALVTGAAQGIGKEISKRLSDEGAHVVLTDVLALVEDAAAEIRERCPEHRGYAAICDVTKRDQVDQTIGEVVERFKRLDLLVNNAGINHAMTPVADISDETYDRVMDVNFRGTFNCCRAVAALMSRQKSGNIVNIGSWYGKQGFANFGVYCASKAAVIRFTESLALELAASGVRVNSVCPGNMATDMHWNALRQEAKIRGITFEQMDQSVKQSIPLGTQGSAAEIASAVVYLASKDGAYVTGQALNVNGGCLFH